MAGDILDHIIRQMIGEEIGFSGLFESPFVIDRIEGAVEVRLPSPSTGYLDYRPDSETADIVGKGETVDEALKDACILYRVAARDATHSMNLVAGRKPLMQ